MSNKSDKVENLTLGMLEKASEKYKNIKEVSIFLDIDGENVEAKVEVYKVFSPIKIKELVMELVKNIDYARKKDRDGFGNILEPYVMYLLIKHFTTLGEEMPSDFSKQLISLEYMLNTTALVQIFVHFDEKELDKITQELELILNNFENNNEIVNELKDKYKGLFKDKSLLE